MDLASRTQGTKGNVTSRREMQTSDQQQAQRMFRMLFCLPAASISDLRHLPPEPDTLSESAEVFCGAGGGGGGFP